MFKKNSYSHKENVKVISLEDIVSKHNLKKIDFYSEVAEAYFHIGDEYNLESYFKKTINIFQMEIYPLIDKFLYTWGVCGNHGKKADKMGGKDRLCRTSRSAIPLYFRNRKCINRN